MPNQKRADEIGEPDLSAEKSLAHDLHVSASTRLTEALVASEMRMRQRIDLLAEVVFEIDSTGNLVFLNRAWQAALGDDPKSMMGSALRGRVLADDQPQFDAMLTGAGPVDAEVAEIRFLFADRSIVWMEMSVVCISAPGPFGATCLGHVGTLRDITDQKRNQDDLKRLSLVANFTDNFAIITDSHGRIEWVNNAFTKRTGYALDAIKGQSPGHVLQGPETSAAEVERIRTELVSGRSFSSKILNYTAQGEGYWTTLHVTPIRDADGQIERYISVQTDTTELHYAQIHAEAEKLRAENANREKSMFLANMSHELRTPMTGVLGLADLLLMTALDPLQRKYVETLRSSTGVLLAVLNDVLDFSKIEQGEIEIEHIAFAPRLAIDTVANLLRPQFDAKGLDFVVGIDPNLPTAAIGDPTRLQQILYNLIGNALKFTRHGRVELRAAFRPSLSPEKFTFAVEIIDTGIGISPDAKDRLFRPFTQGDPSTTRQFGGTGLGLWICQRLVTHLDGEIGFRPNPGGGSIFWFTLDLGLSDGVAAPRLPTGETTRPARLLKILLADDNDVNRMIVRAGLERMGHEIEEVTNGRDAVDAVMHKNFDVIFMDMQMPVLDGGAATAEIRKLDGTKARIPIIALTADAVLDHRGRYMSNGLDDFLVKPIDWPTLTRVLDRVTDAHYVRRAD